MLIHFGSISTHQRGRRRSSAGEVLGRHLLSDPESISALMEILQDAFCPRRLGGDSWPFVFARHWKIETGIFQDFLGFLDGLRQVIIFQEILAFLNHL